MPDTLVTPPVRSPLMESDGKLTASRDWWLYFNQMAGRTNANGQMVTYGASNARPDAGSMPDGALYMQINPGYVMYQNIDGAWHYVAGTQWGTLSPDQRPTGLGPNDAGFTFRGTDQAREYIWSGTAWVETGDIVENSGSPLPVRGVLNFTGAGVTAADDTVNLRTNITIPGGGTGGGAVSSVFGRTGAVTAQTGDYVAYQVTNAVDSTVNYVNPPWIFSLAWNKIIGVPVNTKGDLLTYSTAAAHLAVGADGQVLTADSTQVTGLRWAAPGSAPVASVFGRTGAVAATSGDYTAAQVTNAVDSTASYANPAWLTSLGWAKITGAPAFLTSLTPWTSNINGANYTLYSVGTLGVGTASPSYNVHVLAPSGYTQMMVENTAGTGDTGYLLKDANRGYKLGINIGGTGAGILSIFDTTSSNARVNIHTNGNVGIGLVPTHQLHLSTDDAAKLTTNTWTIASGAAVKQRVKDLEGGLEIINQLRPTEAEYNGKGGTPKGQRVVSVIAEEARKILPHTVTEDSEGNLGFNVHEVIFQLILAVQQLSTQVKKLEK